MSLIACGSIHEGHGWFSDDSRGRQEIFMCLAALLCDSRMEVQDIDQVLLHEIIFFFLNVFSSSAKITSIRSKLPTVARWSREKKKRDRKL